MRIWPIALAAVIGCAMLVGLGIWQLQRLQWKEGLLSEFERRSAAPAISLNAALAMDDIEYRRVTATGTFVPGELHVLTTFDGHPGWQIVQVLLSDDGIAVLVDRGIVPDNLREPARRPALPDEGSITAVASKHTARKGLFTPDNDLAANIWHSWDIPAMLAASHVPPDARIAPFVLHAIESPPGLLFPKPAPLRGNLVNNHLYYALTWFALALVLAVLSTVFIRQQMRRSGA